MKNLPLSLPRIRDLAICIFLLFAVVKLYGAAVNLWFIEDDTQILKQAIKYEPLQYFAVPEVWQELSDSNFTPWVTFSFAADYSLFGLNPRMFYVHQLVALWLCSVVLYFVLRLWSKPLPSFLGACLFLAGTPVAAVSRELMTRHYVEGLLFSLLSLYFFVKGLRTDRFAWSLCAAFFCLAAMTAKEVYAPLALLLVALPEKDWKTRLKFSIPLFSLLLFYLFWRWWMLGALVGGYNSGVAEGASWISKASHMFTVLTGAAPRNAAVFLCVLVAVSAYWICQTRRRFLFSLWVCILVVAPVLTIPDFLYSYRQFLVIWVMIAVLCSFVFGYYWSLGRVGRLAGVAFIAMVFLTALASSRVVWADGLARSRHMSEDGKFYLRAGPENVLAHPAAPPWYYEGLDWLRRHYGLKAGPKMYYDDIYLCGKSLDGKKIWTYSPVKDRETEITGSILTLRRAFCGKVRWDADLKVKVDYGDSILRWRFGPYKNGEYAFVLGAAQWPYSVPRSGSIRTKLGSTPEFRVRYTSPNGWITYSPVLGLRREGNLKGIEWARNQKAEE